MTTVLVDTNFFLECKDPAELDWAAALGAVDEVRIVVPNAVIAEVDRHKGRGNSRKQDRARRASAWFRKALLLPAPHEVMLRESTPRVVLLLPHLVRSDWDDLKMLDQAVPDDRIIAECHARILADPECRFVSDDTNMVLKARAVGLQPILMPATWKLPVEQDEKDKEIAKLAAELNELRRREPDIKLQLFDEADDLINGTLQFLLPHYAVPEHAVMSLLEDVRRRYPLQRQEDQPDKRVMFNHLAALGIATTFHPPSVEAVGEYERAHAAWIELVESFIRDLPKKLARQASWRPVKLAIANVGFANASNLRLTIEAEDGVLLFDDDRRGWRPRAGTIPSPPQPPRGPARNKMFELLGAMPGATGSTAMRDYSSLMAPHTPVRDPNSFYFVDRRPSVPSVELELRCEAFPHQVEPCRLCLMVVLPEEGCGRRPRLRVRAHAANLRRPVELYIPIDVKHETRDLLADAGPHLTAKAQSSE